MTGNKWSSAHLNLVLLARCEIDHQNTSCRQSYLPGYRMWDLVLYTGAIWFRNTRQLTGTLVDSGGVQFFVFLVIGMGFRQVNSDSKVDKYPAAFSFYPPLLPNSTWQRLSSWIDLFLFLVSICEIIDFSARSRKVITQFIFCIFVEQH